MIGAGSGGLAAAKRAAELGAKVAICERDRIGGTCVNRGCVPKKWLVHAAECLDAIKMARSMSWNLTNSEFKWSEFREKMARALETLNKKHKETIEQQKIHYIEGQAEFIDKNTILINKQKIQAKHIIIAAGGRPYVPDIPGSQYAYTSDDMFNLVQLPKNIHIIGGGYIAVEFASILSRLGSNVTIVYRGKRLLKRYEKELVEVLQAQLTLQGIKILFNTDLESITKNRTSLSLKLNETTVETNAVLMATGREPNLSSLNFEKIKLTQNNHINVNQNYQTNFDTIYAIGDINGLAKLTPVAIKEGRYVADYIFNKTNSPLKINYSSIPSTVFCIPPISACGLTEEDARISGINYKVFKKQFKPLISMIADNEKEVFIKMIVEEESDIVLGLHLYGDHSSEIMQLAALAITHKLTKKQFDDTVAIHPTLAEELVTL